MQHKVDALVLNGRHAERGHLSVSVALLTTKRQGWVAELLISWHVMLQDTELKQALEAAQQRLQGLDVEDLDAEREQLALAEHILEKLTSNEDQAQEATEAAVQSGTAAASDMQQTTQAAEQKPVALLGPP